MITDWRNPFTGVYYNQISVEEAHKIMDYYRISKIIKKSRPNFLQRCLAWFINRKGKWVMHDYGDNNYGWVYQARGKSLVNMEPFHYNDGAIFKNLINLAYYLGSKDIK